MNIIRNFRNWLGLDSPLLRMQRITPKFLEQLQEIEENHKLALAEAKQNLNTLPKFLSKWVGLRISEHNFTDESYIYYVNTALDAAEFVSKLQSSESLMNKYSSCEKRNKGKIIRDNLGKKLRYEHNLQIGITINLIDEYIEELEHQALVGRYLAAPPSFDGND